MSGFEFNWINTIMELNERAKAAIDMISTTVVGTALNIVILGLIAAIIVGILFDLSSRSGSGAND